MAERLQGEDDLRDAALHVVDARTAHDVAVDFERHVLECAHRPDRVVVAEQHLQPAGVAPATFGPRIQMAAMMPPTHGEGAKTEAIEAIADDRLHLFLRRRHHRRRFGERQCFQKGDEIVPSADQMIADRST